MSNLLGVEADPQIQPAECSWGSGDKRVNGWFLRVMNPDVDTTSLLMGEIFFKHLAQAVGYVHRDEVEQERVRLIEELGNALRALDNTAESIGATRQQLAVLDSLEGPLAAVRDILSAFQVFQNENPLDEDADEDDDEEGPVEPSEPQHGPKSKSADLTDVVSTGSDKSDSKADDKSDKSSKPGAKSADADKPAGKPAVRKDS